MDFNIANGLFALLCLVVPAGTALVGYMAIKDPIMGVVVGIMLGVFLVGGLF